jgi:hypothetical protein
MRLAAVILLFKEQAFIEASVRAIYPVVDSICCASQYDRNISGEEMVPDQSLNVLLNIPDPQNKIRLVVSRDVSHYPGLDDAGRMRNAARALDPQADYYLIVDSDEVWPANVLREAWAEVQRSQWAAYRISSYTYFRKWNYRVVEPGHGYRPLVFLRQGFEFANDRQVNWRGPARWKEYFRKGRKPKMVYLAPELRLHHGSSVGDDTRITTKLKNYSHASIVDPDWFERVWKNFHSGMRNFHYFTGQGGLYESIVEIPTPELPEEVRRCAWPEGWIEKNGQPPA